MRATDMIRAMQWSPLTFGINLYFYKYSMSKTVHNSKTEKDVHCTISKAQLISIFVNESRKLKTNNNLVTTWEFEGELART